MLFSSIFFIFSFLPAVLLIYYLSPMRYKNIVLLIASIIFYSWGEPIYVFLMLFSATFNYSMAKDLYNNKKNLIFTVIVNLFILSFFKYYGFLIDTVNSLFNSNIEYTSLALPIGISFYTFQGLSYIIDVYRGNIKVQNSLINFTLYLCLFPQLIAGPIVKYKDIELQLNKRSTNLVLIGHGTIRFIMGLGKKVLLANNLGLVYTQIMALSPGESSVVVSWIGIIAYTMQIYFDFSGYSDMAIGLGKMFGFEFMENFNYPYISKSITEFWRRWHISLSTWFKEYLYIPLGGNRVATPRHIFNLLVVWSLTGLWHGASWNFVVWGLYYGVLLILEKYLLSDLIEKLPSWAKHVYTLVIVMIGWVFFSSENLTTALQYIGHMFGIGDSSFSNMTALYYLRTNFVLLLFGGFISTPLPFSILGDFCGKRGVIGILLIFGIFILSIGYLVYSSYNPFLYFRF